MPSPRAQTGGTATNEVLDKLELRNERCLNEVSRWHLNVVIGLRPGLRSGPRWELVGS